MDATLRFAVIGDPVGHSISPLLHNTVFRELGIDAMYEKIHVEAAGLGRFASETGLDGFNVTIPHKQRIVPFLAETRGDAVLAGAVNTVVRTGVAPSGGIDASQGGPAQRLGAARLGRLVGHNTDMDGLHLALQAHGRGFSGRTVCVFGTGGAASGAAKKARAEGAAEVRIIGRSREKAEAILPGGYVGGLCADAVRGADLFINATPLGMSGHAEDFDGFAFLCALSAGAFVYDCVYTPAETSLVKAARAAHLAAESGLSMLVWQGLMADALFLSGRGVRSRDLFARGVYSAAHGALARALGIDA